VQSKISLVRSKDHETGVQACLKNIENELKEALSKLSSLLIKVNFVDTRKELACTPFQAVKSFVDFITVFYKKEIIIAEAPTWGVKIDGFQKYGYYELVDMYPQITFLNLRDDESISKLVNNLSLPFSKKMLKSPFIVSITRPKTHSSVGITLGIKNVLVGAINGGWKSRLKVHKRIHQNLLDISEFIYPNLVVIDGFIGMEGRGPLMGTEKKAGWCISSLDPLAADSLATYLMGHDIEDIGYLYLMGEAKKGAIFSKDEINIIGENPETLITPFKPHNAFKKIRQWR
jgi:uncharacterized protein (DUF362 family)